MKKLRLVAVSVCLATCAFGQRGRTEVQGDIGWTGFLDDSRDDHVLLGASLRTYLSNRFSIQPEFQYLTRSSDFSGRHYDLVLLGNFGFDLRAPGNRVIPFLIAGPGILRTHQGRFSSTNFYGSGGGGVKIFVSKRWYIAPDFRVGWEPHARFTVGAGYVWRR